MKYITIYDMMDVCNYVRLCKYLPSWFQIWIDWTDKFFTCIVTFAPFVGMLGLSRERELISKKWWPAGVDIYVDASHKKNCQWYRNPKDLSEIQMSLSKCVNPTKCARCTSIYYVLMYVRHTKLGNYVK